MTRNSRRVVLATVIGFLQLPSRALELVRRHRWIASLHSHPMMSSAGFADGMPPWLALLRKAWAAMKTQ
jgi:hypothetical protein